MCLAGDESNNVNLVLTLKYLEVEMEPIWVTICTKSWNMLRKS